MAHAVGDRIDFAAADLLPGGVVERWDVVLANLPYVRSATVPELPKAASFEPTVALDGGPDGLKVIGRLLDLLPGALAADGVAMLEIGGDQAVETRALVDARLPGWTCEIELDLGRLPRVAILRPRRLRRAVARRLVDGPEARAEAARVLARRRPRRTPDRHRVRDRRRPRDAGRDRAPVRGEVAAP